MYRGEPPTGFFPTNWKPWREEWHAGGNLHLVDKVGASSTSPPMQWADPAGLTSEDLQAFIATNTKLMSELKTNEHMDNYVLGETANGTGCFHLETKDAQEIHYKRVCRRINHLESEIACDQCCCAGENVCKAKVVELADMGDVREMFLLLAWLPPRPFGEAQKAPGSDIGDNSRYYAGEGIWLWWTTVLEVHAVEMLFVLVLEVVEGLPVEVVAVEAEGEMAVEVLVWYAVKFALLSF